MPSYSPKGNYILLEALKASSKSSGGIHIPQSARQEVNQGRILEFGPDVDAERLKLQIGEIVIFPYHAEYRFKGEKEVQYIIIPADSIIAGDDRSTPPEEIEEEDNTIILTKSGRKAPIGLK